MKTFKSLRESTIEASMNPTVDTNIINNLVKFSQQISQSFQPNLTILINKIESELNKFALTLGDVDTDTPFEDEGTDDYIIHFYSTKEVVKNVFLTLSWRRIQGQQFEYTTDGSKLVNDVNLIVNLVDPTDMDSILNSDDEEEMTFVRMDESKISDLKNEIGKDYEGKLPTAEDMGYFHGSWGRKDNPYKKGTIHHKHYESGHIAGTDDRESNAMHYPGEVDESGSDRIDNIEKSVQKAHLLASQKNIKGLSNHISSLDRKTRDAIEDSLLSHKENGTFYKKHILGLTEESLNEISKSKLNQYVKKASDDLAVTSQLQGSELQIRNNTNHEGEYDRANKNVQDYAAIRARRKKGIAKAVDKLTEESLESRPDLQGWHDGYNNHPKPGKKSLNLYYRNNPDHISMYHASYDEGKKEAEKDSKQVNEARGKYEQDWDKSKSKIVDSPKSTKDKVVDKMKKSFKELRCKLQEESLEEAYNFDVLLTATHADTGEELTHQTTVKATDTEDAYEKAKAEMLLKHPKATYVANIHTPSGTMIKEASDPTDVLKINVPAFIRCMEYAMEDVKEDAELHEFVEHLLAMSKNQDVLDTDAYEKAVEACSKEEAAQALKNLHDREASKKD